jgi:glutaconyl-CoA/methylmalonyl-CoA decarboxylase subunit delta
MTTIYISFPEGIFISIFSILIVFLILFFISIVIESLKHIKIKEKKQIQYEEVKKKLTIDDIKDDDMMVAALIASIDYQQVTKGDVQVLSIKEIKPREN